MRFSTITFGLTAVPATFVAGAPISNGDVVRRMPTPDQFDALSSAEKREIYQKWYRPVQFDPAKLDSLSSVEKREVYRAWYRATNIIAASDDD